MTPADVRTLLDTDTCIDAIRGRSRTVVRKLRRRKVGSVGISSVTYAELCFGVHKSPDPDRNRIALAHFCAPLVICQFDGAASEAYGRVRATLEYAGTPIGPLDTLIAAHALSLGVVLISHNTREFRRVERLKTEDWIASA